MRTVYFYKILESRNRRQEVGSERWEVRSGKWEVRSGKCEVAVRSEESGDRKKVMENSPTSNGFGDIWNGGGGEEQKKHNTKPHFSLLLSLFLSFILFPSKSYKNTSKLVTKT